MPELDGGHWPRWPQPGHHHKLTYYAELDMTWVGLPGLFMVWHCNCGERWSIKRRGYERLIRGEIKLEV